VKPANISVSAAGEIRIPDFGVAKVGWDHPSALAARSESAATKTLIKLTKPGTLTGTLAYLSPEQARGEDVGSRTDIFSLGVVMYEMTTGRQPFHGEAVAGLLNAILTEHPRRPSESNAAVSRSLERIIEKALAKQRCPVPVRRRTGWRSEGAYDIAPASLAHRGIGPSWLVSPVWLATQPGAGPKPVAFTQLTDSPGEEVYPSLASDGKSFVYQSRASEKWEIYLK
jgi:serine/threonine protein kinase